MSEEDMRRFEELEKKMDEGIATEEEMMERDTLWSMMQLVEEQFLKNFYQFGY